MKENTERYKSILLPIILNQLPKAQVILYGSRARGDEGVGSDVDLALDCGNRIDENILSTIKILVEESDIPVHFDIVDFQSLSDRMKKEILKDGVIWKN